MKDNSTKFNHNRLGRLLRFFFAAIGLLVLLVIAECVTFGQIRVSTGGSPAGAVRYGAGGSIRYGHPYAAGAGTRLLPSEERYVASARGLLPSQERYRRASSGMLPSAGRYGYMTSGIYGQKSLAMQVQSNIQLGMGTIRYGGIPVGTSVPVQPPTSYRSTLAITPYAPLPSVKMYNIPIYPAQGSIRYGAMNSFSPEFVLKGQSPSPVGTKVSPYAPETVLATRSATSLNIPKLTYPSGSIRYGKTPIIAVTAGAGLP